MVLDALNVHLEVLDVSEDTTSMSVCQIMKKEVYLTRLIGVLTCFTKHVETEWSPGDEAARVGVDDHFSITLNENVPLEVQAMVYEIHIHILLGMTHPGRYVVARRICAQAFLLYLECECSLRCVRIIERLLYITVVDGGDIDSVLKYGEKAIDWLTSKQVSPISDNRE